MTISAKLVMELRERTGSAMMDCKKALVETNGDIEVAAELMRKSGAAKADKKASRVTAEGIVVFDRAQDGKTAVLLEVNSETDFVARDSNFLTFAKAAAACALAHQIADINELAHAKLASGETVEAARQALVAKIGENIQLRRIELIKVTDVVGGYVHSGRIGVAVEMTGGNEALAKDIAMHIAASNPVVVNGSDVPADLIAKEREIFKAQAEQSGKPAEIVEKMVQGRINKYLQEVSLKGQPFVKNPDTTVEQLLKAANADVKRFIRFTVGEGIEKQTVDFAQEVMSQVNAQ